MAEGSLGRPRAAWAFLGPCTSPSRSGQPAPDSGRIPGARVPPSGRNLAPAVPQPLPVLVLGPGGGRPRRAAGGGGRGPAEPARYGSFRFPPGAGVGLGGWQAGPCDAGSSGSRQARSERGVLSGGRSQPGPGARLRLRPLALAGPRRSRRAWAAWGEPPRLWRRVPGARGLGAGAAPRSGAGGCGAAALGKCSSGAPSSRPPGPRGGKVCPPHLSSPSRSHFLQGPGSPGWEGGAAAGSAARRMAAASRPLGDCNKCRGGAAAAERGVPRPRGPSRPLPAPLRGPGMGGWKPGLCRLGAGEISGLPAVEKGEPLKLGSPLPSVPGSGVRGARRVPGEQQSERNSAQDISANVSFAWKYKCTLKGIYSYPG